MKLLFSINLPDKDFWEGAALVGTQAALGSIQSRLTRGIGALGQRMPPYSEAYKKRRLKRGRQSRTRDLFMTGRFRKALRGLRMQVWDTGFQSKIGLVTGEARLIGSAHQKRSKWFGFSEEDVEVIQAALFDFAGDIDLNNK